MEQHLNDLKNTWLRLFNFQNQTSSFTPFVFAAPKGLGKTELVRTLAQWILCEQKAPDQLDLHPCGDCLNCRRVSQGNQVDLLEISAFHSLLSEENKGTQQEYHLKIDQTRALKTGLGFKPFSSPYRIILLLKAELLTPAAANSLLKLLEEPPKGWIFLITVEDVALLLPTVQSRCKLFRLRPSPVLLLEQILEKNGVKDEKIRKTSISYAMGNAQKASLYAEEKLWKQRQNLLSFLKLPSAKLFNELIEWGTAENSNLTFLCDFLEQGIFEFIQVLPQFLVRFKSKKNTEEFLFKQIALSSQVREYSHLPINRKLLVQSLLSPWLNPD